MNPIQLAHSPDADDIFMYFAIKFGWVGIDNIQFDNIAKDIQTLNEDALYGVYDIVAISFALYPRIKEILFFSVQLRSGPVVLLDETHR